MKYVETTYGNGKEILKFPDHYVAVAVTVDDTGIVANADGKKIVPKGTVIGGVGGAVLADPTLPVAAENSATAEGVLFNDVDVTYGKASGAMLIHAFIKTSALPVAPDATAIAALAGRIMFMA